MFFFAGFSRVLNNPVDMKITLALPLFIISSTTLQKYKKFSLTEIILDFKHPQNDTTVSFIKSSKLDYLMIFFKK